MWPTAERKNVKSWRGNSVAVSEKLPPLGADDILVLAVKPRT